MTSKQIIELQKHVGTTPDGRWGLKSISACNKHLRNLMPKDNPWPKSDYKSMVDFYGPPGEFNLVTITFPITMFYDGKRVKTTRIHKKCADSFVRVLTQIQKLHGDKTHIMDAVSDYGGCFNHRNSRGATSLSKHAWGAAVDLAPDNNPFRAHWPMKATMPIEIMEEFAREGWLCAGAAWSFDAMHFQGTR
jgi:hypothetical protein